VWAGASAVKVVWVLFLVLVREALVLEVRVVADVVLVCVAEDLVHVLWDVHMRCALLSCGEHDCN
jgi:hypothetical protein